MGNFVSRAVLLSALCMASPCLASQGWFNYFSERIAANDSSETGFNSTFESIVSGRTYSEDEGKMRDVKLTPEEQGRLISQLLVHGLALGWVDQKRVEEWDRTLQKESGMFKPVSSEVAECFTVLKRFGQTHELSGAINCEEVGRLNLSRDFLPTCKQIAKIITRNVTKNEGTLVGRGIHNITVASDRTVLEEGRVLGQQGLGKCSAVASMMQKELGDIFRYVDENPSGFRGRRAE